MNNTSTGGYVRCRCGSRRVSAYSRYSVGTRKLVRVDYKCHDCGATAQVGSAELTVPTWDPARLRQLGFVVHEARRRGPPRGR